MSRSLYTQGQFITPKNLFFGETLLYESFSEIFERMISQFGILLTRQTGGTYSNNALVSINGTTTIDIQAFEAIIQDADGITRQIKQVGIVNIDMASMITYPSGSYNVLVQKATTYQEVGTIEFTYGSDQVVGTDTEFTKNIDKYMNLVIEGSGSGNNGRYVVLSVEDDENLTLQEVFTGTTESGLDYSVGGRFPDAAYVPSTLADYRIYQYDTYEFVITTNAATTGQYRIATVAKPGGILTSVVDKRTADNNFVKFKPTNIDGAQVASGIVEATFLPVATGSVPGIVSIGTQSFAGQKTFLNKVGIVVPGTSGTDVEFLEMMGDQVYPYITMGEGTSGEYAIIGYNQARKVYIDHVTGAGTVSIAEFSESTVTIKTPLTLGNATIDNGRVIFLNENNAYTGTLYAGDVVGSSKSYFLPNLTGTVALADAGQNFSDVGAIVAVSLTVGTLVATAFNLITVNVGVAANSNGSIVFYNDLNTKKTTLISSTSATDKTITLPNITGTIVVSVADTISIPYLSIGTPSSVQGNIYFYNSTNAFKITLTSGTPLADFAQTLPNISGTVFVASSVNVVSPTAPNRTFTINISGTTYYIHGKTTND